MLEYRKATIKVEPAETSVSLKSFQLPAWITYRKIFLFILILNLFTRVTLTLRPLPYLDGKLLPDDAYYSLKIARNIGNGHGPLYTDSYTNGFQPLYVFLMAPAFMLLEDQLETPVKVSLLLLALFDTATLAVLLLWIKSLTGSTTITMIASLFWIFNDYVIRTSLNGLETAIAAFFLLWASYFYYKIYYVKPEKSNLYFLGLGVITGFACFSRVDSCILALILGVMILYKEWPNFWHMITRAALFSIGVFAIFSIWIGYSLYYTGDWFPVSGKAIRFIALSFKDPGDSMLVWHIKMFAWAGYQELKHKGVLIFMIIGMLLFAWRKRFLTFSIFERILPLPLFGVAILMAYTLYVFAHWFFDRYFFPITLSYILIFSVLLHAVASRLTALQRTRLYAGIIAVWFSVLLIRGDYVDYFFGEPNPNVGYMNLGLWAENNLPPGTVVGASQSGAIGYFTPSLKVVNLDGVVNKECFHSLQEGWNMDYIKAEKIDYVVGWQNDIKMIKMHSKNFKESDLTFVKELEGFKSWNHEWYLYKVNR